MDRSIISEMAELVGFILVVAGLLMIAVPVGICAAGFGLMAWAYARSDK